MTVENEEREGPLQPASRQIICQPPHWFSDSQYMRQTHTYATQSLHAHTLPNILLLLQHSRVSDRKVVGGECAYTPLSFSAPSITSFSVFHSLPSLSYIIFHLFNNLPLSYCGSVALSHSLVVSPCSLHFVMTSICLFLNLLNRLERKKRA